MVTLRSESTTRACVSAMAFACCRSCAFLRKLLRSCKLPAPFGDFHPDYDLGQRGASKTLASERPKPTSSS